VWLGIIVYSLILFDIPGKKGYRYIINQRLNSFIYNAEDLRYILYQVKGQKHKIYREGRSH